MLDTSRDHLVLVAQPLLQDFFDSKQRSVVFGSSENRQEFENLSPWTYVAGDDLDV